jgi:hypothetical protein
MFQDDRKMTKLEPGASDNPIVLKTDTQIIRYVVIVEIK